MSTTPWNMVRRVPQSVDEANEFRQKMQDRRLDVLERSFEPPLCIEKRQNGGEVLAEAYAEIPGLSWTTTIESAWRVTANLDWQVEGANWARCLVGGVEQTGALLFTSTAFVRCPGHHIWHTGIVAAGTVIMIQAHHEGAGVGRVFQVNSQMVVDQVSA